MNWIICLVSEITITTTKDFTIADDNDALTKKHGISNISISLQVFQKINSAIF